MNYWDDHPYSKQTLEELREKTRKDENRKTVQLWEIGVCGSWMYRGYIINLVQDGLYYVEQNKSGKYMEYKPCETFKQAKEVIDQRME